MTTETHEFTVGQPYFAADDGNNIIAECSCGWEGRRRYCVEDALDEWENHCDQVSTEAKRRSRRVQ